MRTNLNSKPISEVNQLQIRGEVNLRPNYQRRPVWSYKNKVYLIDTILQGLPIPKFFIQIKVDSTLGNTIYEVVDGQQRLTAIFEFIQGKTNDDKDFILSRKQHPKPESFPDSFEGLSFKTLTKELKDRFWLYKLSLEELEEASEQEINDMFIRLNLSGAKLNNQELRNAAYNGDFKTLVYEVADEYVDYLVDNKILSASNVKRMIDAEFTSELIASMIKGMQDKKKTLDKIYSEFDSMDEDDIDKWKKSFRDIMKLVDKIMEEDLKTTRFKNKADFYNLFYVLYDLTQNKNYKISSDKFEPIRKVLIELSKNVKIESSNIELVKYFEKSVNAGDVIANRKFRHNILTNIIEPFCISRDERRHFSDFEKEFLWHSSQDKKCGICGEVINSFDDYQIDHIKAWDNGGDTDLSNAQLAHASCNKSKGNR
ncbi:DUF262 domain-containing protein [bacterium]|nr:DUF262 domain-containing protein [bacterium]